MVIIEFKYSSHLTFFLGVFLGYSLHQALECLSNMVSYAKMRLKNEDQTIIR